MATRKKKAVKKTTDGIIKEALAELKRDLCVPYAEIYDFIENNYAVEDDVDSEIRILLNDLPSGDSAYRVLQNIIETLEHNGDDEDAVLIDDGITELCDEHGVSREDLFNYVENLSSDERWEESIEDRLSENITEMLSGDVTADEITKIVGKILQKHSKPVKKSSRRCCQDDDDDDGEF